MTYDFESLDTVPLHPWTTGLQLFDIMIKTHRRSFFPSRTVRIKRVGSMLNLGKVNEDVEVRIEKVLNSDRKIQRLADLQASTKRNSSLLTSIAEGFGNTSVSVEGDKSFSCTVTNVISKSVPSDFLMDLVDNSSWQPDLSKHVFQWPVGKRKTMKLWVVTEILYANKISVKDDSKKTGNAEAKTNSTNIEGKVSDTSEEHKTLLVTAPTSEGGQEQQFPFVLKALKLEYDAHGKLISKRKLKNDADRKVISIRVHVNRLIHTCKAMMKVRKDDQYTIVNHQTSSNKG